MSELPDKIEQIATTPIQGEDLMPVDIGKQLYFLTKIVNQIIDYLKSHE